jgi:amino acid adenylation domain-containing protein
MNGRTSTVESEAAERAELLTLLLEQEESANAENQQVLPRRWTAQLPLSFAQERLWVLEQLEPVGSAYNIPVAVRLQGQLNLDALERAFAALVERHEVLRTRFEVAERGPVQVIQEPGKFLMEVEDLSDLPAAARDEVARERTRSAAERPFDLARGPLFRVSLLKLSATGHVVLVGVHHIISDGWSMGILIREVGILYRAFVQGQPSPLPELPVQYADYAIWQREWLQGEVLDRQLSYWRNRLNGVPAALELPADRPRPAVQSYRGSVHSFALSKELSSGLRELGRREGATLFMVLLAAFKVVLSRWSGQTDVVVGTPIAGRTRRELEGLIGFFVNVLALRTDMSGDPSFCELLRRVKQGTLEAFEHQDIPFEKLVEVLQPVRDLSRQPVFQVLFALQNVPQEQVRLPGLTLRRVDEKSSTSKLDLSLFLQETSSGLDASLEYATDLFDRAMIERLAGHLRILLQEIVTNPDCLVGTLPLLSGAERDRLLHEWNDTASDYPHGQCIHELITEQAARTPDAVALVYEDSELTYGELDLRSNQVAHHLVSLGVGPETVVCLCLERSLEMVVGLLGILKAGAAYLPLDPSYPQDRLLFMQTDAGSSVVMTAGASASAFPLSHSVQLLALDADWDKIARHRTDPPTTGVGPKNLAYVIYTSGSTGKPKAAMNCHGALINRLLWMQSAYGLSSNDRVLQKTPFTFDVSVWEFIWPLVTGATLVLARPGGHKDAAYLMNLIDRARITTLHFVPSMLQAFLEAMKVGTCRSLRRVICSGEALSSQLQQRFFSRFADAELHNLYGPTEAAIDVTYWVCQEDDITSSVPIGRPIWNTQVYVLDGGLEPVPVGVAGELYIGGVGLARGYLSRPGLTAERFVPSPYGEGERLYRTGDLVRWRPDGELEFLGRLDHQVKLRGYRIELGEIETVLSDHPAVRQGVVVAREDAPGDKRLVAYVVGDDAAALETSDLRAHLKRGLPEYMVPSAFVVLDALPLTPNGKVDRKALPVPEGRPAGEAAYEAPRTPTEQALAEIWAEILRVERVGIHDNFFILGGHSLLATRVIMRTRDRLGMVLPLRTLFESPTIAQWAKWTDETEWTEEEIL